MRTSRYRLPSPSPGFFFSHTDPNMVEWFVKMVEERKGKQNADGEKKEW